jgi:hypothetical protein
LELANPIRNTVSRILEMSAAVMGSAMNIVDVIQKTRSAFKKDVMDFQASLRDVIFAFCS